MMTWKMLHPRMTGEALGLIPYMLDELNPRPARDQFNDAYGHGGGWRPFKGFTLHADNSLSYPDDPPLWPLAECKLRDELVVFYPHSWVAVIQKDRSFEVCRMD